VDVCWIWNDCVRIEMYFSKLIPILKENEKRKRGDTMQNKGIHMGMEWLLDMSMDMERCLGIEEQPHTHTPADSSRQTCSPSLPTARGGSGHSFEALVK
jgi:hypothetical protein